MKGIKFFYITCPKKKEAQKIATFLVKKKLVACANIINNVESVFSWKSKVVKAKEILVIGKTMNKNVQKIINIIENAGRSSLFLKNVLHRLLQPSFVD